VGGSVRRLLTVSVLVAALGGVGSATPATQNAAESKDLAQVYTEVQAKRGEEVFATSCGSCHGPREFASRLFQVSWAGRSVEELYSKIRTEMPQDKPGTLTEQQYVDVVAHVLQLNRFPAGATELPADTTVMQKIQFLVETP
jgi:mono/diheme cytochrome c family protein